MYLALRVSVGFANTFWIPIHASGWQRLQVLPGTATSPCCSPLRVPTSLCAQWCRGVSSLELLLSWFR